MSDMFCFRLTVLVAALALWTGLPVLHAAELKDYGAISLSSDQTVRPGAFVWMDLLTNDVQVAAKFYADVFGWRVETSKSGDYAYATLNGNPVASFAAYDEELGDATGLWLPSAMDR